MTDIPHDGRTTALPENAIQGDPQARAAMLLVESLLHGLVARSILSIADAVDIIDTAVVVEEELVAEAAVRDLPTSSAQTILDRLATSLALDLPHDSTPETIGIVPD